ncbi:hypothetical protein [Erwinia amylovora]|uniref:hypothetical protein n=1 Tax=Erwinia amylovora TaxID=552 RepID=UPI001443FECF|nr:hypothetical protein [Erwinia amylovora]
MKRFKGRSLLFTLKIATNKLIRFYPLASRPGSPFHRGSSRSGAHYKGETARKHQESDENYCFYSVIPYATFAHCRNVTVMQLLLYRGLSLLAVLTPDFNPT